MAIRKTLAIPRVKLDAFVRAYRETFNARASAIAAGYATTNTNAKVELLQHPYVQSELQRLALRADARSDVRVADILKALMQIAYFDPVDVFDRLIITNKANGQQRYAIRAKDLHSIPKHVRQCMGIKMSKQTLGGAIEPDTLMEVSLPDNRERTAAMKLLMLHKGQLRGLDDDDVTDAQFEAMDDETALATHRANVEKYAQHLEAKRALTEKVKALPDATRRR